MYRSIFLLPAIVLCTATGLFSAKYNDRMVSMGNLNNQHSTEIKKPSLSNRVQMLEDQMIENSVESQNPNSGYINFEFLYWRENQTLWNCANVQDIINNQGVLANIIGKPEWKPGGRIEIGFTTGLNWNVSAMWTYHYNKSHSHYSNENGLIGENFFLATEASSVFKTNYNIGDLQLSSLFSVLKNLFIKPYIGAQGAWIKYTQDNKYSGVYPDIVHANNGTKPSIDKWYGVGPSFGMTGYFNFGKSGLSFFGGASTALLYGNEKQKVKYVVLSLHTGSTSEIRIAQSSHQLKAHLQLLVGADFKWKFDQERKALSLHAAWETNYWWHLGEKAPLLIIGEGFTGLPAPQEDLSLYGINVGIGFDY